VILKQSLPLVGPERHPIQLGAFDFDRAMGKAGKKKAEAKGGFFDAPWTAGVDFRRALRRFFGLIF